MKRALLLLVIVVTAATVATAQNKANFLTNGGPHVITGVVSGASGCTVCHTPHNGNNGAILLWNPDFPTTGVPFSTYAGSVITSAGGNLPAPTSGADPHAHSFLCLSCHDGVAATANFGTGGALEGATQPSASHNITNGATNDLTDDHPINFTYPDPLPAGLTGVFETLTNLQGSTNVRLWGTTNDSVQCATCHDPHNNNAAGAGFFLRTTTTTDLCVTCHL